jgi:hypothetical protein
MVAGTDSPLPAPDRGLQSSQPTVVLCRSLLPTPPEKSTNMLTETQQRAVEQKCPFCKTGTLHIIERAPPGELIRVGTTANTNTSRFHHRNKSPSLRHRWAGLPAKRFIQSP